MFCCIVGPEVVATIFKKGDLTISSNAEFAVVGRGKFQGSFVSAAAMSACTLDGYNQCNACNNVTMEKGRKEFTESGSAWSAVC